MSEPVGRSKDCDIQVVRFTATGSVDSTFNSRVFDFVGEGGTSNDDQASSIVIQPNDQIVEAGWHDHAYANTVFALARFNVDGSFDSTFGTSGIVTTNISGKDGASALLTQSDGKLIAICEANNHNPFAPARFLGQ